MRSVSTIGKLYRCRSIPSRGVSLGGQRHQLMTTSTSRQTQPNHPGLGPNPCVRISSSSLNTNNLQGARKHLSTRPSIRLTSLPEVAFHLLACTGTMEQNIAQGWDLGVNSNDEDDGG